MKRFIAMILVMLSAFAFASCGGNGDESFTDPNVGKNGTLKITYYKGGTGAKWINELAAAFEKETLIKVELTEDSKATENSLTWLQSDRNLPDLAFVLYTNWQKFVQNDYLAPMDDLYNGTFSATFGEGEWQRTVNSSYSVANTSVYSNDGKTEGLALTDIMCGDYVNYGKTSKTLDSEKQFWVMPWTSGTTGFVYNVNLLKQVGYDNPPETYAELLDLCKKLTAKGITPFSWGGEEMGYWDFVTMSWWAQYSGVSKWQEFWSFESPEVFNDEGRKKALEAWQTLLVGEDGKWINSIDRPMGRDHMDAQKQFVSGKAAMIPTGSWIENEIKDFMPDGFEMRFMPTPAIEGAKTDEKGNIIQLCNTEAGDFAYIPKNASNVKAAKAFLAFMNRPEWIEKFTLYAGMPRPFNYKPSEIEGISSFTRSSMEYYENSVKMWRVSDSPIYTYAGIRQWDPYGSTTVYGNLAGSEKKSPQTLFVNMYENAKAKWNIWLKSV